MFFASTDATSWMVENVLLGGETVALFAPKKCTATSFALDLLLGFATRTQFSRGSRCPPGGGWHPPAG